MLYILNRSYITQSSPPIALELATTLIINTPHFLDFMYVDTFKYSSIYEFRPTILQNIMMLW